MVISKVVVVIPGHNEAGNLRTLVPELLAVAGAEFDLAVIVVDDGSTDLSQEVLRSLCFEHSNVTSIRLPSRSGKARALSSGFVEAMSMDPDIVCTMDGDCQDNPEYLTLLVQKALSGFDLVTARRVNRAEKLPKRVSSKIYNRLIRYFFRTPGKDHNSGMKALSPSVVRFLIPFMLGDMHRHISVLAHWQGFSLAETDVTHRERREGNSKYGVARLWFGFEELVMLRFLLWRLDQKPGFFGMGLSAGVVSVALGSGFLSQLGGDLSSLDYVMVTLLTTVLVASLIVVVGAVRSVQFFKAIRLPGDIRSGTPHLGSLVGAGSGKDRPS